jgi:hypothetical protein
MDGTGSEGFACPFGESDVFSALRDTPLNCDQLLFDIVHEF